MHGSHRIRPFALIARTAFVVLLLPVCASAQELTPGPYWPLPSALNIFTIVNNINWGDVAFDPSLPVEDASAIIDTTGVSYSRTLAIAGRSANVGPR